jgi:hypothetical protein
MEYVHLPTFRLFVQHGRPVDASEEADLHSLFKRYGHVDVFQTKSHWRNSIVTFASTTEAVKAKKALDRTDFRGLQLKVKFMRPTRRVVVRGLPDRMSASVVKRAFKSVVRVERDRDGKDFVLVFDSEREAKDAVADTRPLEGYEMSFDFGNEEKDRRQSSPKRRNRSAGRQRSRSPPRSKKRSRSPPRAVWIRPPSPPPRSKRRSQSPRTSASTVRKHISASPSPAYGQSSANRSASPSFEAPPTKRNVDVEVDSSSSSPAYRSPAKKNDEVLFEKKNVKANVAVEEEPVLADVGHAVNAHCHECSRLMTELIHHVTDRHVDANQKAVIKAWFDGQHK